MLVYRNELKTSTHLIQKEPLYKASCPYRKASHPLGGIHAISLGIVNFYQILINDL